MATWSIATSAKAITIRPKRASASCSARRNATVSPIPGDSMEHIDHILVVDDDHGIRTGIVDYLRKNGLRATGAAEGREMFAQLDTSAFDLVVLDIMMPGDDGLVLCRTLRAGKHKHVPVVLLTARDDETDRIIGLEMGADDYVTKPFSPRELLARIKAVIRRTRMLPPNLRITETVETLSFGRWRL